MWKYTDVKFIYSNPVDSKHGEKGVAPVLYTYVKSKYAVLQALTFFVQEYYPCGVYTSFDPRSVKYDKPIKV